VSPRTCSILFLLGLAGCTPTCGSSSPALDAGRAAQLSGIVRDEKGVKGNATVRLYALTPSTCLCPDDPSSCECPEALADHHRRAAACPPQALVTTTSNENGAFALATLDAGNVLYASSPGLGRWQPIDANENLSLQLEPARGLDVTVTGAIDLTTVTALFDNGWCRKLERHGIVFTADDLPLEDATVLVEAPGLTPVVLFSSPGSRDLAATLRRQVTISGNCPRS